MADLIRNIRCDALDAGFDALPEKLKLAVVRSDRFHNNLTFAQFQDANGSVSLLKPDSLLYNLCLDVGLNYYSALIRTVIDGDLRKGLRQNFGDIRLKRARMFRFGVARDKIQLQADELTLSVVLECGEKCLKSRRRAQAGGLLTPGEKIHAEVAMRTLSSQTWRRGYE